VCVHAPATRRADSVHEIKTLSADCPPLTRRNGANSPKKFALYTAAAVWIGDLARPRVIIDSTLRFTRKKLLTRVMNLAANSPHVTGFY